jgi:hypothetical protein
LEVCLVRRKAMQLLMTALLALSGMINIGCGYGEGGGDQLQDGGGGGEGNGGY